MPSFVVVPRIERASAIVLTIGGWTCLGILFLGDGPAFPGTLGNPIVDIAIGALFVAVLLLTGPIGLAMMSFRVEVSGGSLSVSRWFGIQRRSYSMGNIRAVGELGMDGPRLGRRLRVEFDDGARLHVGVLAAGYDELRALIATRLGPPPV